eukprot:3005956-Pleurochrysis_carterae.AAC.1
MASPASGRATEMFKCEAAKATAALLQAVRTGKRASGTTRSVEETVQAKPVDWVGQNASAWKRYGMLTAFRMRGEGGVLFTAGRDVVRETEVDGRRQL